MTQIFLSYARDDDLLPPNLPSGKQASGFVTALHNQLLYEFRNLGGERPELWRDIHGIDRAEQFASVIETQINQSDLLLVVLSLNWIKREWCQRELEAFQKRWGAEARGRTVVVSKRFVPLELRPALLQGQEGYDFFFLEPRAAPGEEQQYFDRGVVSDDRYYDQVTALARYLSSFDDRRARPRPAPVEARRSARPNARTDVREWDDAYKAHAGLARAADLARDMATQAREKHAADDARAQADAVRAKSLQTLPAAERAAIARQ